MRSFIATIISIIVIITAISVSDTILKERSEAGIIQGSALYHQPEDTIDVAMIGSSHVHCGINTACLFNDYGITAYDYSSAEQPLWCSYYYIKEFCKNQNPKVIVLDFFTPAIYQDDYEDKYYFMDDTLYGMKFSMNKLRMMNVALDGNLELIDKYFPAYFGYHDRYSQLKAEDVKEAFEFDYEAFKGYSPRFHNQSFQSPVLRLDEVKAPSDKSVEYLNKIIEYTGEKGIQLYITSIPYAINDGNEVMENEEDLRYNWLEKYVLELQAKGVSHVYYDYTFKHPEDFGIDYEGGSDFSDGSSHLNYYGSTKYTKYLGQDLRRLYGEELLPDHRGDERYASYDRHVLSVKKQVEDEGWEWR